MEQTKFLLAESRDPEALVQHPRRHAEPAAAGAAPGHRAAGRARRPRAALPDGADHAGGQRRGRDPDPRGGARHLQPLAADAALPGAPARAGGRDAVADLLQVRGRQPAREPQAEHRGRAGLLQQAGGPDAARDRDRRRASGGARSRSPASSSASSARSTWSGSRTTRSRTGGR